jgi:hypothetical protein
MLRSLPGWWCAVGSTNLRGQAALEMLLAFLGTLAMISILVAALSGESVRVSEKAEEVARIRIAEDSAMAVEGSFASGMDISIDDGILKRLKGGRMSVDYGSRSVEVRGIFVYDDSQPQ